MLYIQSSDCFCESETCAFFPVLFCYFATLPKDAALVQNRSSAHFITGIHHINVIITPKKLNKKAHHCLALFWSEQPQISHSAYPTVRRAGISLSYCHFKSGANFYFLLFKFSCERLIAWWCHSHWPCVCTKGLLPQTAGSNHNNPLSSCDISISSHWFAGFVAHYHSVLGLVDGSDFSNDITYSLTNNRASLLTILMFSTGFLVCSCNVLYTVANTFFFFFVLPFLSDDMNPRATCVC